MERADDIGVNKVGRPSDRTINVRFGGQMKDVGYRVFLHDRRDCAFVAQIRVFEHITGMPRNSFKIFEVAGIREAIEIDKDPDVGFVNNMMDEIGADETGAARD
jgi:hypothetical protein